MICLDHIHIPRLYNMVQDPQNISRFWSVLTISTSITPPKPPSPLFWILPKDCSPSFFFQTYSYICSPQNTIKFFFFFLNKTNQITTLFITPHFLPIANSLSEPIKFSWLSLARPSHPTSILINTTKLLLHWLSSCSFNIPISFLSEGLHTTEHFSLRSIQGLSLASFTSNTISSKTCYHTLLQHY